MKRLMPSSLGGRLVWTVVLLALATTTVAIAAVQVLMAAQGPQTAGTLSLVRSSVVAGVLAILTGVFLGVFLARRVRGPILDLVDRVKRQGALAVEGTLFGPTTGLRDPRLPLEFRELGAEFEDLLDRLSARQADLRRVVRDGEAAEEALGMVVDESREAKLMIQEGRIIVANPAACVALGRTRESLLAGTARDALTGAIVCDENGVEIDMKALLDRALDDAIVVSVSRDDQPVRWYLVQASRRSAAPHARLLVTARDVTGERRLGRIRSEIVSLISHDLRSPLTVIVGYLDLLRRPLTDDDRNKALDAAKLNAERMSALLEDLLSATRAEELLAPDTLLHVALAPLAEEVVTSLALANPGHDLVLEASCSPIVQGEERRLRQVLVNLVTNALKHASVSAPIAVQVSCEDDIALVRVVDHGPGIAPGDRDVVFERFMRLENAVERSGVGLGLYIVRVISENHGGGVRIDDTPGGGATFTVELPCTGHVIEGEPVLENGRCPARADVAESPLSA